MSALALSADAMGLVMNSHPLPPDEAERLKALQALEILETDAETEFDTMARAASIVCNTPICLITFVDKERQWFKANVGMDGVKQTSREGSFCAHTIMDSDLFEVPDAMADPRFANNALVTGGPKIRFYAGAPIQLSNGHRVGSLCVIDNKPRRLDDTARQLLRGLGIAVSKAVEARQAMMAQDRLLLSLKGYMRKLAEEERRYRSLVEQQSEMVSICNPDGVLRFVNPAYADRYNLQPRQFVGKSLLDFVRADERAAVVASLLEVSKGEGDVSHENRIVLPDSAERWIGWTHRAVRNEAGKVTGIHSVGRDIHERMLAEQRLAASEARYRFLAEHTVDMILLTDKTGRCLYASPASRGLLGYEPDEMLQIPASDAIHPDDVAEALKVLAKGASVTPLKFQMMRKSGEYVWVEASGQTVSEPGVMDGNLIVIRNIEARVAFERRTAEIRERNRRFYESTPALLQSIDTDGRLVFVSDAWLTRFGYTRPEVIGRRSTEFLTAESREYARKTVVPAFFLSGRCDNIAYEMICKSGEIVEVDLSAIIERDENTGNDISLAVILDVTERRRAERKLIESEARYRCLADNSSDVVFQLDADLRLQYVSPACLDVLGFVPQELIGTHLLEAKHVDDAAGVKRALAALLARKTEGDSIISRFRHRDGHWIWAETRLRALGGDAGKGTQGIVGTLRDVTERQRIAEELVSAKMAAESAARLKSEFVANMSHELRTPLTGILGLIELLRMDPTLRREQRRRLEMAHEAGQSLMGIVNDVLDFSKIEAGHLTIESARFELNGLISACHEFVAHEARKKSLTLELRLNPMPVALMGDAARLRQIILNLLSNAIKFSKSGRVVLEARYEEAPSHLCISVSDSGIGIASDKLVSIFDRFTQGDGSITRQYGGTGLGLAICRRLVELMGGKLSAVSTPGIGSTFSLEVPLSM